MKAEKKKNTRWNKRRVASEMPKIEINLEAIMEIKERKRGFYQRYPKRSKRKMGIEKKEVS